jgi:hypothetical protein
MRIQPWRLLAVCSASMVACGSQPLSGSGAIPRDQLIGQFAALICDHLAPCCQADGLAYDSASCRQTAQVDLAAQYTFVTSSHASYDGLAARGCLNAFAAAMPACGAADAGWNELPLDENEYAFPAPVVAACKDVFKGTAPAGTACTSSKECALPAEGLGYCEFYLSGECAVYTAPYPHAAAGAPCVGSCETIDGTPCYGYAPTTGLPAGAECYASDGLECGPAPGGAPGGSVCLSPGAIGQSCAGGCVPNATCNAASLCVAISELGGPCETDAQCVVGSFCDAGACASPRDTGPCLGPYQSPNSRACSSASYCDLATATCLPKMPDGASCTQHDACINDCGTPNGPREIPSVCVTTIYPSAAVCMGNL